MVQDNDVWATLLKSRFIQEKQYINIIAWLFMLLGGLGWISGLVITIVGGSIDPDSIEFPLGDLNGIAVDSVGRIYCNVGFYSRVQQYDKTGKFLKSWSIDADGGMYEIRINARDELEVITARTDSFSRYDISGKLLEEKHLDKDSANELLDSFRTPMRVQTTDGTLFATRLLFPSIVKITSDGQSTTLVSVPFHKWLVMGPFPAWLFCVIAIGLLRWKNQNLTVNIPEATYTNLEVNSNQTKKPEVDQRSYIDKLRGHRK